MNICKYYHAENDKCGFAQLSDEFESELPLCNYEECMNGCYEHQPDWLGQHKANDMIDEHGNINWPLAFGFDKGFRCETFNLKEQSNEQ